MLFFWCAGILLVCFIFFFVFGYYCFSIANRRKKRYPSQKHAHGGGSMAPEHGEKIFAEACQWFDDQVFESVSIQSCDGLHLTGRLLSAEEKAKGIVIGFHGYHSSDKRDLAIQTQFLHQAGYHVLLATQRSHGKSEGTYICFGVKERMDVAPWCHFALNYWGNLPVVLLGLSMGASTVLMSSDTTLPPQVQAMIADCGFTTPWAIIKRTLRRKHKILPYPVIYFMNYWSRILAGFDYRQCSVTQIIEHCPIPILLIHGTEDLYVPYTMSEQIAKANPNTIEFFSVSHARHAQAVLFEPEEYRMRVLRFLETHLES